MVIVRATLNCRGTIQFDIVTMWSRVPCKRGPSTYIEPVGLQFHETNNTVLKEPPISYFMTVLLN